MGPTADGGAVPRLRVREIEASYGARKVLTGVTLDVMPGEILTVLGHNGAGKTTLLRSIFGLVPHRGDVLVDGADCTGWSSTQLVGAGLSMTPAVAPVFRELSVSDNLRLGAFSVKDEGARRASRSAVLEMFPILAERSSQLAGTLSGGQQRQLSLGMALMSGPSLMLLDEPSLGIAPSLVSEIFSTIRRLADETGMSVLLIEQNVRASLPISDRAAFMRDGKVLVEMSGPEALARGNWWDLF